jgi:hypothetical protein
MSEVTSTTGRRETAVPSFAADGRVVEFFRANEHEY